MASTCSFLQSSPTSEDQFISAGLHEAESGNAQTLQTISKAATLHINDHKRCTEPHETVNTHFFFFFCLYFLTLLNFLWDSVRSPLVLRALSLLCPASSQLLFQSAAPTASTLPRSHRASLLRPAPLCYLSWPSCFCFQKSFLALKSKHYHLALLSWFLPRGMGCPFSRSHYSFASPSSEWTGWREFVMTDTLAPLLALVSTWQPQTQGDSQFKETKWNL